MSSPACSGPGGAGLGGAVDRPQAEDSGAGRDDPCPALAADQLRECFRREAEAELRARLVDAMAAAAAAGVESREVTLLLSNPRLSFEQLLAALRAPRSALPS